MIFYLIVHLILGFNAGNCSNIQIKSKVNIGMFPLWVHGSYGHLGATICVVCAFAAPITTLLQWGIGWAAITVAELIAGAFISGMFPLTLRIITAAVAPIVSVIIVGALWGFWYI